jgi:hypothetical protein
MNRSGQEGLKMTSGKQSLGRKHAARFIAVLGIVWPIALGAMTNANASPFAYITKSGSNTVLNTSFPGAASGSAMFRAMSGPGGTYPISEDWTASKEQ